VSVSTHWVCADGVRNLDFTPDQQWVSLETSHMNYLYALSRGPAGACLAQRVIR
jgi:hypothetical protein